MTPATPILAGMPEEILCKITVNFGPTENLLDTLKDNRYLILPPAEFLPLRQVCKAMDKHLFDRLNKYIKLKLL